MSPRRDHRGDGCLFMLALIFVAPLALLAWEVLA